MPTPDQRRAFRDACVSWAIVAGLVAVLIQINITLPAIGHLGGALVAVLFLYVPVLVAWRRKEDLDVYGFHAEPVAKGLVTAGVTIGVIFPVFALGYFAFYEVACSSDILKHLAPNNSCSRFGGFAGLHVPVLSLMDTDLASLVRPGATKPAVTLSLEFCLVQLIVVGLPEELFFRGLLLSLLEKRFPPRRRILGGGVGLALVLSSIAFGLIHLPKEGPLGLATFFPGLLFGWMRSATGSILASTVTHAASNILIRLLNLTVLR